ncbi:hypothetical protein T4D_12828 [Trichinella pseudospiralis]|uniref:Uncharacterized protein n=1 Tax=Trichinella pseudospiralis TaxID=6337 RepID=A0A0V1FH60_TRIPS|nr:hypothetical protein T4D_12828 [Trichinella pseudospiralis]
MVFRMIKFPFQRRFLPQDLHNYAIKNSENKLSEYDKTFYPKYPKFHGQWLLLILEIENNYS